MRFEQERRNQQASRMPVELAVELGSGELRGQLLDAFEADAVNLSRDGISMRSPCLPDVGTRLLCRFGAAPDAPSVVARGEVVWAHLDRDIGQFGMRFIDMPPDSELVLDEILADPGAPVAARGPAAQGTAGPGELVELDLDCADQPIAARVARVEQGSAVFEQPLLLFQIGRGVRARGLFESDAEGVIGAVELKAINGVPVLSLRMDFDRGIERSPQYGEFPLGDDEPLEHDTEPDAWVPPDALEQADAAAAAAGSAPGESTMPEYARESNLAAARVHDRTTVQVEAPVQAAASAMRTAHQPSYSAAVRPQVADEPAADEPAAGELEAEAPTELVLELGHDAEEAAPARGAERGSSPLVQGLARAIALATTVAESLRFAVGPRLRGGALMLRRSMRRQMGPFVATLRRFVLGGLTRRKRRKTALPDAMRSSRVSGLARYALIGVLAAGAAALSAYALVPADDSAIELPPPPAKPESTVAQPTQVVSEPEPAAPVAVPAPGTVPDDSPFAVDVREQRAQPEPAAALVEPRAKTVFGAAQAPDGKRFTLNMSNPVKELRGVPDPGGFTVLVPGSLSLDRAGPIASTHRAVERSMILNKGDRSELTIRFADGKRPAYQVKADGNALKIVIEGS